MRTASSYGLAGVALWRLGSEDSRLWSFYDKDLNELFKSRFERIGIYENKSQIWSWAWTISYFEKNETNIIIYVYRLITKTFMACKTNT